MINNDENDCEPSNVRRKTNFTILCITFILVYTSFNAVTNLQSSIHEDTSVGYYSLAILSGCTVLSCLFFTNPLIFLCGYKWTIVLAQFGFLIYTAANIYPKVWLIYPASVICGLFKAGFWTALSAYVSDLSIGKQVGPDTKAVINKYFGIFFATFQSGQIWGNLISYMVLRNSSSTVAMANHSSELQCGAQFAEYKQKGMNRSIVVNSSTAYILYGVFMGLIVLSIILIILMLDQKRKWKRATVKDLLIDSRHFIISTFKQMKYLKQLLILPLAFWIGTFLGFVFAIFTSSFITCTLGLPFVGLIMITYGITASIFSVVVGCLGKYNLRVPCYIFAAILCYASYLVMLLWKPVPSQAYVLFILAGMLGIASAIWDPIEAALYGILFVGQEEAAYSNLWLGQNIGYFVVYIYGPSMLTQTAIILQIIYLTIALLGYFAVEILLYKKNRRQLLLTDNHINVASIF
ncbi:unnamed protein product [Adineta steineri]|uniref:UNC93-like protein n=4 Tax=Adineta steineri TaxID=433720 RepID=A0A819RHP7_9BILA|nr:unnamed protein product [Adineta steineri]CAF4047182.1 unnamed protein product [Adineta steineri]